MWATGGDTSVLLRPVKMKQRDKASAERPLSSKWVSSVSKTWIGGTVQRVSLLSWPRESVPQEGSYVWGQRHLSISAFLGGGCSLETLVTEHLHVLFFVVYFYSWIFRSIYDDFFFYIFICWAVWGLGCGHVASLQACRLCSWGTWALDSEA